MTDSFFMKYGKRFFKPCSVITFVIIFAFTFVPVIANASQPYRTTPHNLDVQVIIGGQKYYLNDDEWGGLSLEERNNVNIKGLVIDHMGKRFVVKITMELKSATDFKLNLREFSYEEAVQWVNRLGGGWRMPTKAEGEAMADQHSAVNATLDFFGCEISPAQMYWTCTKSTDDSSYAWCFDLYHGRILETCWKCHLRVVCDL